MKKHVILLLFTALFLAGCAKETLVDTPDPSGQDKVEATLTLRVSGSAARVASRAMDTDAENEIEEIDILVFSKSSTSVLDKDATYSYRARTTRIIPNDDDSAEKSFRVTLEKNSDYQRLVVFANSRTEVETALEDFTTGATTYEDAMAALVMTRSSAWNSADNTYDPLPMWGQNDFKVFTSAAAAADRIDLVRSLARIDVAVASAAQGDFTLSEVHLYNPSAKGLLAPSAANWSVSDVEVTGESIPSGARPASTTSFPYTTLTTADIALQGVIYTFEAPAAASNKSATDACLIVKGSWKGEADSYYRIDFHDGTKFLPLLRNFQYNVSIDAVSGRGYTSAGQALAAGFTAMTASTQTWSEGSMGSVVWDGSNYLAVSTNEYTIYPEAQAIAAINAATNYSGGWKAEIKINDGDNASPGVDWITIDSGSESGTGNNAATAINMTVLANTVHDRTATITVTAGRLKQVITVTQKLDPLLSLDVGDVEVVFSASDPQSFSLPIEWEPAANPVKLELIHAGTGAASAYSQLTGYSAGLSFSGTNTLAANPATLADANGITTDGGANNLIMKPDVASLATFAERRSILKITSDNGTSTPEVKTVLLRQFDYAIEVTGIATSYQLGTTYSVTLKANAQWAVEKTGPDADYVSNLSATEGEPNTSGITFTFTTGDTEGKTPVLNFYLKEHSKSQAVSIPLKRLDPNCYIVYPEAGKNTVTIPIRKVYEAWNTDPDLNGSRAGDAGAMEYGNFTTGLLWQDAIGLIPTTGISGLNGTDEDAYFTVTVNTAGTEGNAVVFLKENGTIRWSWHIWVLKSTNDPTKLTAYTNPSTGAIIMDRNLGATTNFAPESTSDIRSHGLFYQWGRKDPFVGSAYTDVATRKPIYDYNTQLAHGSDGMVMSPLPANVYDFAKAFYNPLTFYTVSKNGFDSWILYDPAREGGADRIDLWGNGTEKTTYDPCPKGWRVPDRTAVLTKVAYVQDDNIQYSGMDLYHMDGNYIGFFPFSGYMYVSGSISNLGLMYNAWQNEERTNYNVHTTGLTTSTGVAVPHGLSIRCVKIQ